MVGDSSNASINDDRIDSSDVVMISKDLAAMHSRVIRAEA